MAVANIITLVFVSLAILASSIVVVTSSPYLLEPFDVEGIEGKSVTIYCRVKRGVNSQKVYWGLPRDLGAIGPNTNGNNAFGRYKFTGDPFNGYYNLEITDVIRRDEGSYSCIYTDSTSFTYERQATLDVINKEEKTDLQCEVPADLRVNDITSFKNITCSAKGGVPLAGGTAIQWKLQLKDDSLIDIPGELSVYESTQTVVSTIKNYKLSGLEDYSKLICSTKDNIDICVVPKEDARFRVRHKPLVTYIPSEIEVGMFETYELEIKCIADGFPSLESYPNLEFTEGIDCVSDITDGDDSGVPNRKFKKCKISISRADIDKEINCTASNDIGSTTSTIKIRSLGGLTPWLITVIILAGGLILFLLTILFLCLCCDCDLAKERKRTELKRKTLRESKATKGENNYGDDLDDINLQSFNNADNIMLAPESPHDSGNYPGSREGSINEAMVNDYKVEAKVNDFQIEEPEYDQPPKAFSRVSIVSEDGDDHDTHGEDNIIHAEDDDHDDHTGRDDDDDDELPPKPAYLHVHMEDDTDGEQMDLGDIIPGTSPTPSDL